jgi:hypothetical protein
MLDAEKALERGEQAAFAHGQSKGEVNRCLCSS